LTVGLLYGALLLAVWRRRKLAGAAGLSLVFGAVLAAAWVRGMSAVDTIDTVSYSVDSDGVIEHSWSLVSQGGGLMIGYDRQEGGFGPDIIEARKQRPLQWTRLLVPRTYPDVDLNGFIETGTTHVWNGFEVKSSKTSLRSDAIIDARDLFLVVPDWFILALLAILPAAWLIRGAWRLRPWRWEHKPEGRCRACGYDLTGNQSGTCPECGTPAPLWHNRSMAINRCGPRLIVRHPSEFGTVANRAPYDRPEKR
jgi:hypothetical protein